MHANYSPDPYKTYLFVLTFAILGFVANTWFARYLPATEGPVFIFAIATFVSIIAVLWAHSPKLSVSEVFTTFENNGGWSTIGLSTQAGQVLLVWLIIGGHPCWLSIQSPG